jgi:nanoRNase/pAp phosphatase (c-di-AMP/oligoRNAs hydrolase)
MAVADISSFKKALDSVKSAIIILPENPSMDTVAAGLSLSLALKKQGLSSVVSAPNPMTVEFNRLVGVNNVREDLGDKNLVVSFADYPADGIERVAYNIENGEFVLTIVPKPGQTAPKSDQIITSYSGISSDLVIIVGANYPEGLGRFAENKEILEQENLAIVGNTPLSGYSSAMELIDPSGSSVSDVVYDIIEQAGLPMDEDIATNLFMGLEAGTHNFTSGNVNAQTFSRAANLLSQGARRNSNQAPASGFNVMPGTSGSAQTPQDLQQQFREGGLG